MSYAIVERKLISYILRNLAWARNKRALHTLKFLFEATFMKIETLIIYVLPVSVTGKICQYTDTEVPGHNLLLLKQRSVSVLWTGKPNKPFLHVRQEHRCCANHQSCSNIFTQMKHKNIYALKSMGALLVTMVT